MGLALPTLLEGTVTTGIHAVCNAWGTGAAPRVRPIRHFESFQFRTRRSRRDRTVHGLVPVIGPLLAVLQPPVHGLLPVLMPIDAIFTGPAGNLLVAVEGVGKTRLLVAVQGADAF